MCEYCHLCASLGSINIYTEEVHFFALILALQGIVILIHPSPRKCRSLFISKKVTGSSPRRSGGRMFFPRVNFLCWLSFWYLFHRRVTAVVCKSSWSFCQKAQWQVTAKHACTLCMWLWMKWQCKLVHDYMVYIEHAPRWQQFEVAPAM